MNNIYQITAGKGPEECALFVAQFLKYIVKESQKRESKFEIIHTVEGKQRDTFQSVIIRTDAIFLDKFLGTIMWRCQSPFRKNHKRKNWFISISQLQITDSEVKLLEKDVKYQAIRSGGPGGQHVNKVSTAIRATHVPSGEMVLVSDSRSQLQNKKLAFERLQIVMNTKKLEQDKQNDKSKWLQHHQLERGNELAIFEGERFLLKRVNK